MNTILLTHFVIFVKSQYHQGYKGSTIWELLCDSYFYTFLFQFPIQSTTRTTILVTPGTLQRRLTRHRRRKRPTRRSDIRRKTVSPVTAGSRRPESRHMEGQSVILIQWSPLNGIKANVINQLVGSTLSRLPSPKILFHTYCTLQFICLFYQLVIVISFSLFQSDPIKQNQLFL